MQQRFPKVQGLYDPANEHDNCGIGFVAHIKGKPSNDIVRKGLEVLVNMTHRGAESSDNKSGDGAGILMQVPHEYFSGFDFELPAPGHYGTGLVFLPGDPEEARGCLEILNKNIVDEGLELIGYRDVPVNSDAIGEIARSSEPLIRQVFVTGKFVEQDALERKLFLVRKMTENAVRNSKIASKEGFYIVSLSTKVFIYKGMLTPAQLGEYFVDLQDPKLASAIALVHSRFSTNTFPTWDLAQPFRILAHNGEINTIKGNRLWMQAREGLLESDMFGEDLKKLFPVIETGKSDSASLDNVLEFLFLTGRTLPHALTMLIPESWNDKNPIPPSLKAYYEYHSTIMEPWDGPASIVFSDGRYIGGTLDRNGLRPSRYVITDDDLIVMGSEVGVQTFPAEKIVSKGRLKPGKLLLVDTRLGIIIPDEEIKSQLSMRHPYENWLKENRISLKNIEVRQRVSSDLGENYDMYLKAFGYNKEDVDLIIKPMSESGVEPIGSMGNDTPMSIFSDKPQRLFSYFRQHFAQVTNPAIDPIREGLVMALTNYIGSVSKNILVESYEHCRSIKFASPLITNTDLGKIKDFRREEFSHVTLPMLFPASQGGEGLKVALEQICTDAEKAVDEGNNYIILSDRGVSLENAAIPSLLATAAVHHHLIKAKKRMQVGLIVETGEAREVMHFALLLGYGASVINPYVCFATINEMVKSGKVDGSYGEAREKYIKAVDKGLMKVLSKMGISTLRSYHGAQIFEAIGISNEVIERYFTGTTSRIGGVGFEEIAREALAFHQKAFDELLPKGSYDSAGAYAFRKYGEKHAWNPETIGLLQWATARNDYQKYKEYSRKVESDNRKPLFLRGFLNPKKGKAIDVNEVEPVEAILKRFVTGAMSYGSISKEAHEALAMAMNEIGGRSNTGEGGEDSKRFKSPARSSIKQVASGRFGVTNNYLVNADELQIKVAQGAKPGEGGQLPGYKVDKVIAKLRNSTPGITLISPPPHHDIYSIEDLAQLIFDLKNANPRARVSVKLVSETGVGTVAAGVAKAHADLIVISGTEGGTGASPTSSIKHAGLPVELGLAETQQTLVLNNLRGRVKLQTDGQLKTGHDVIKMALLGAEEYGFATSGLIVLGCVMMRKCHLNTCPAGIATQDEELRKRFIGKYRNLVNFFTFIATEVREILSEMGYRSLDEIIGRSDLLERDPEVGNWKTGGLDLSGLLHFPREGQKYPLHQTTDQDHKIDKVLDRKLIEEARPAIQNGSRVWMSYPVNNTDRTVGAMLSGEVSLAYGEEGLPKNTINCSFTGSAGQSFGAFLVSGVSFRLEGDANDYLGKGLSGGKIVVVPPTGHKFKPEENIIIGNTVLYGATGGHLYVHGVAGERFAVRNSGANAVVEGTGDHCCEYMTGGRVVVIGPTGRNFAAGMSGGIAYVLDESGNFDFYCNKGLVDLMPVQDYGDVQELQFLLHKHLLHTNSEKARQVLVNWEKFLPKFVKVIPFEYKKVLEQQKVEELEKKLRETEDAPHLRE
ncbi:glutamate synthase large subunit [Marinilabilia salmonicolor]|jgi:glutamate synthase (NADPH/NADH) large chain|uniref:Glutamate synthase [NADPH] large chain n=1 Tax=Marinilabilia salmonicolor TaxID=989 RepID=A0A368V5D9_9BACT|nr:glutamate synthase large subunit [Marinilabilia salmonicolor]RCW36043.1 glutamate synthase (NADPH/NADH) large chain [Marinilabilia salmonicolor]